jgi:antitoxin component YwqK of YwqJK toxin-antitoxin module
MKITFLILLLGTALNAGADTFLLKDGARLEGEVTGEMDGALLIKTKYGSLTINKTDVQEQLPAPAAAQPAAALPPPAVAVSTLPAVEVSTQLPTAVQPAAQVKLTFATIAPSTSATLTVYTENWVAIATETFDAAGALTGVEGAIKDGTYTEYYDSGALKTVKTMAGGKASGTLKAYYPSGKLQIDAYYLAGAKDGPFKYYAEDGKPLMEAVYKNDKLNGWKKEFGPDGLAKTETYYQDDHLAEPPKVQAPPEPEKEQESQVTVKTLAVARGERFSFQLNGKYIGKATLDNDFNLISLEGKFPDGAVKVYSKEGKLQKELVFEKSAVKLLRVYQDGGPLKASYTFLDGKAIKK